MIYIILLVFGAWISISFAERIHYRNRLSKISLRVHVNGIRGKSSIVRYLASILRAQGYLTLAKTTGTAARIIGFSGQDIAIKRRGRPNIAEQLLLMKHFIELKPDAVVVECMAINPSYSEWLESQVMCSHIYILTNVRLDHQDQLGQSLEDIALSLSASLPRSGTVITGETNEAVLSILRLECQLKNTRLIEACSQATVATQFIDISEFDHAPILENLRVCFAFAELLNIPRNIAINAMMHAVIDPGHFKLETLCLNSTVIVWANLFAVNDKESFVDWLHVLLSVYPGYMPIVILNNRHDRIERLPLFIEVLRLFNIKCVVSFGDCEAQVVERLPVDCSYLSLGNSSKYKSASGRVLLSRIANYFDCERILLIGAINIHTIQADRLLQFIALATRNDEAI